MSTRMSVGGRWRSRRARATGLCAAVALLGLASPLGTGSASANPAECTNTAAITLGAPATNGDIATAGQVDCYTFDGNAGDRVHIRVAAIDGSLVPSTSVTDPGDSVVCGPTTDADQICTLATTGTHTIEVADSTATGTGDYSVSAEDLFGACSDMSAITPGAPPTIGSITAAGQVDCYRFDGNAGERVQLRAVAASGSLAPSLAVVDSTDTAECGPSTDTNQICTLTTTGTATIELSDSSGTNTGGYSLFAGDLLGPCSDMSPIALGAPATGGTISTAGQVDCWTFDGVIGDRIQIDVAATDGALVPSTSVVDGSATTVCAATTDADQTCRLTASGSYAIVVQDATGTNTGDYTVSADEVPVTCATTRAIGFGTLAKVGSIDGDDVALCYTFSARARNRVRVRVVTASGALVPNVSVLGPGGGTVCGASTAVEQTCVIGTGGMQTVMVRDLLGTNTGTFGIYLQRLAFPLRCTPLAFGATAVGGSITVPGDADCYTFRTGGQRRVRVHIVTTSGSFTPDTEIIEAHGTTVCGPSDATDLTCPHNFGRRNQMILVRDLSGPNTGSYAISLQLFPPAIDCSPIRPGAEALSGAITVPGTADCYTFQGAYRARLRLRVVGAGGALVPYADLIGPNGVTLCGPSTTELTCQLTSAGKWTVMIADAAGPNTGAYAVYLQVLSAPLHCRALDIDDPAQGWSIDVAGGVRCYTFAGTKNAYVRFDVAGLDGSLVPETEVLRASGTTLCGPSTDTEQTCKLNVGGTFTILISDAVGTGTGDFTVAASSA